MVGLSVGADDYITKPFSPREVIARVGTVLRRAAPAVDPAAAQDGVLHFPELEIDPGRREVRRHGHVWSSPPWISTFSPPWRAIRVGSSLVPSCSNGSGATTSMATRGWLTCIFAAFAANSGTTLHRRPSLARCEASATSSCRRRLRRNDPDGESARRTYRAFPSARHPGGRGHHLRHRAHACTATVRRSPPPQRRRHGSGRAGRPDAAGVLR